MKTSVKIASVIGSLFVAAAAMLTMPALRDALAHNGPAASNLEIKTSNSAPVLAAIPTEMAAPSANTKLAPQAPWGLPGPAKRKPIQVKPKHTSATPLPVAANANIAAALPAAATVNPYKTDSLTQSFFSGWSLGIDPMAAHVTDKGRLVTCGGHYLKGAPVGDSRGHYNCNIDGFTINKHIDALGIDIGYMYYLNSFYHPANIVGVTKLWDVSKIFATEDGTINAGITGGIDISNSYKLKIGSVTEPFLVAFEADVNLGKLFHYDKLNGVDLTARTTLCPPGQQCLAPLTLGAKFNFSKMTLGGG